MSGDCFKGPPQRTSGSGRTPRRRRHLEDQPTERLEFHSRFHCTYHQVGFNFVYSDHFQALRLYKSNQAQVGSYCIAVRVRKRWLMLWTEQGNLVPLVVCIVLLITAGSQLGDWNRPNRRDNLRDNVFIRILNMVHFNVPVSNKCL